VCAAGCEQRPARGVDPEKFARSGAKRFLSGDLALSCDFLYNSRKFRFNAGFGNVSEVRLQVVMRNWG
jgi:hypothetical protein